MFWTNDYAGGFQPDFSSMCTEVALRRGAFFGINVNGVVRAGLHAGFAADTSFRTEVDDPVLALVHRSNRTDRHARGILAMITSGHLKHAAGIRENALFHVLHPGAVHRERHMVLGLARHGTRVAADALPIVNDEPVSHADGGSVMKPGYCSRGSELVC